EVVTCHALSSAANQEHSQAAVLLGGQKSLVGNGRAFCYICTPHKSSLTIRTEPARRLRRDRCAPEPKFGQFCWAESSVGPRIVYVFGTRDAQYSRVLPGRLRFLDLRAKLFQSQLPSWSRVAIAGPSRAQKVPMQNPLNLERQRVLPPSADSGR